MKRTKKGAAQPAPVRRNPSRTGRAPTPPPHGFGGAGNDTNDDDTADQPPRPPPAPDPRQEGETKMEDADIPPADRDAVVGNVGGNVGDIAGDFTEVRASDRHANNRSHADATLQDLQRSDLAPLAHETSFDGLRSDDGDSPASRSPAGSTHGGVRDEGVHAEEHARDQDFYQAEMDFYQAEIGLNQPRDDFSAAAEEEKDEYEEDEDDNFSHTSQTLRVRDHVRGLMADQREQDSTTEMPMDLASLILFELRGFKHEIRTSMGGLETRIDDLRGEMQRNNEGLRGEIEDLRGRMITTRDNVATLQNDSTILKGKIGTIESTTTGLRDAMESIRREQDTLTSNVSTLKSTVQNVEQRITTETKAVRDELSAKIKMAQDQSLAQVNAHGAKLEARIAALETETTAAPLRREDSSPAPDPAEAAALEPDSSTRGRDPSPARSEPPTSDAKEPPENARGGEPPAEQQHTTPRNLRSDAKTWARGLPVGTPNTPDPRNDNRNKYRNARFDRPSEETLARRAARDKHYNGVHAESFKRKQAEKEAEFEAVRRAKREEENARQAQQTEPYSGIGNGNPTSGRIEREVIDLQSSNEEEERSDPPESKPDDEANDGDNAQLGDNAQQLNASARITPDERRGSSQLKGKANQRATDEMSGPCIHCGESTHPSINCPYKCMVCNVIHPDGICPHWRCNHCGQARHRDDECPHWCAHCKVFGHRTAHCTASEDDATKAHATSSQAARRQNLQDSAADQLPQRGGGRNVRWPDLVQSQGNLQEPPQIRREHQQRNLEIDVSADVQNASLLSPRLQAATDHRFDADARNWLSGITGDVESGVARLTEDSLVDLKVPITQIGGIRKLHEEILVSYQNAVGSSYPPRMAPKVDKANDKNDWSCLKELDMNSFVAWHNSIRRELKDYGIFLTPISAVRMSCGAAGLCLPGLGSYRWQKAGELLFNILLKVVVKNTETLALMTLESKKEDGNGFQLLWRLGRQIVKIWDKSAHVPPPKWPEDNSVQTWQNNVETHRMLVVQRGQRVTEKEECRMMLEGLMQFDLYRAAALTFDIQLSGKELLPIPGTDEVEWHMPSEWTPEFLASEIVMRSKALGSGALGLNTGPAVNRTQVLLQDANQPPMLPRNLPPAKDSSNVPFCLPTGSPPEGFIAKMLQLDLKPLNEDDITALNDPELEALINPNEPHLQGFVPRACRLRQEGRLPRSRPRHEPDPALSARRRQNRTRYNGNCAACRRYGHEEIHCDYWAMLHFLEKYRKQADPKKLDQVVEYWLEKNKPFVQEDPRKVAKAYVETHNVTHEQLLDMIEREVDWDFFHPNPQDGDY